MRSLSTPSRGKGTGRESCCGTTVYEVKITSHECQTRCKQTTF